MLKNAPRIINIVKRPVSIKHGLRTTDYALRTGYKTRTEVKNEDYGLKHGKVL